MVGNERRRSSTGGNPAVTPIKPNVLPDPPSNSLRVEHWIHDLTPRERSIMMSLQTQSSVINLLNHGNNVELRSPNSDLRNVLGPRAASFVIDLGNLSEVSEIVDNLSSGRDLICVNNILQCLMEVRQFLGSCFCKLKIGGLMIIIVPHQFLFERKTRLPSRREASHRRFYTPGRLLSEVEEAIDPYEFRVRFLTDSDANYDYAAAADVTPEGGQDIILVIEKLPIPWWRSALEASDNVAQQPNTAVHQILLEDIAETQTRIITSDLQPVRRIIVLKLDNRGDFILAKEAFTILRQSFEHSNITLICGSWNVAEAEKSKLFDKVEAFDFFPEDNSAEPRMDSREGLKESFSNLVNGRTYDLAADFRVLDDTRELLQVIEARHRAGFDGYDLFPWLTIRMTTLTPSAEDGAGSYMIPAEEFHTSVGRHEVFEIVSREIIPSNGKKTLVWGPYKSLKRGRYSVEVLIEAVAEEFDMPFDIATHTGRRVIYSGVMPVRASRHPRVDFQLTDSVENFEFRLFSPQQGEVKPFRFFGLRCDHFGARRGIHQSEAMALLAHFIPLRLRSAYTEEISG